ncbi:MAG: hypothetical protein KKE23_00250 [Nanoarchaeota archaeon]|nr:hypothetical protein [Nanoarchaeota archaeon]
MVVLRDIDYMKNIIAYIEKNMSRGYTLDQMRFTLMQHGYSRAAIDRGIRTYEHNHPVIKLMPKVEEPAAAPVEPVEEKKGFFSKMFGFFSK